MNLKHTNTNTRRVLRIGMVILAILGAALLLCSTLVTGVGAGIAVAQEQEYQQQPSVEYCEGKRDAQGEAEAELAMDDNDDDVPVKVVYRGYGFALNADGTGTGTEFHALRVNIIRVRQLEPIRIRELMAQNKSIDVIRGEIMEKACAPIYQGYVQFAETHYKLVNINVICVSHAKESLAVNTLAIDADIIQVPMPTPIPVPMPMPTQDTAEPEPTGNGKGNASTENPYQEQDQSAGNISLNVLNLGHENFITIGEGKLTIRGCGEASQFQYHVLLRSER